MASSHMVATIPPGASAGFGQTSLLGRSLVGRVGFGSRRQHHWWRGGVLDRRKTCCTQEPTCGARGHPVDRSRRGIAWHKAGGTPLTRQPGRLSWCCWPFAIL